MDDVNSISTSTGYNAYAGASNADPATQLSQASWEETLAEGSVGQGGANNSHVSWGASGSGNSDASGELQSLVTNAAYSNLASRPDGLQDGVLRVGAPPTPPPPDAIPGGPWIWTADPNNSRGGTFLGQNNASASWDAKDAHWDIDNGQGERSRYNRFGAPLTPDEAHGPYKGPPRLPLPFRFLFRGMPFLFILPGQEKYIPGLQQNSA